MSMTRTSIEWTDYVWNPVTGCTKVSPGCDNCYAETFTERFSGKGSFERVMLHPERLDKPLRTRKPGRVFVNSMSDLFHDDVPDGFIGDVFNVMALTPQHTYQILTKRHARMRSLLNRWADAGWYWRRSDMVWCGPLTGPLPNVWLGVSVEDQKRADIRIDALRDTPAAVRFLSCEPMLGPLDLSEHLSHPRRVPFCTCGGTAPGYPRHESGCGIEPDDRTPTLDWVIAGGESGPNARPVYREWVAQLRDDCVAASVPFFFKQWGGRTPKAGGAMLDGREWREFPR